MGDKRWIWNTAAHRVKALSWAEALTAGKGPCRTESRDAGARGRGPETPRGSCGSSVTE